LTKKFTIVKIVKEPEVCFCRGLIVAKQTFDLQKNLALLLKDY